MSMQIRSAAMLMSVQDAGRMGYLRYGLPHSGPMDWWAFRCANLLVGNRPGDACIEIGMSSCDIHMEKEALAAVCGAGYRLFLNQHEVPLWMSFLSQPGDQIRLEKCADGNWVYLAVAGGIRSIIWLGSRSVYPRGDLGCYLRDGDQLPFDRLSPQARMLSGRSFPRCLRPDYSQASLLSVLQGPDSLRFQPDSFRMFFQQTYHVSSQSDRMGYRLLGPPIMHRDDADIVSRGMVMGEIQVPGNGQPIVMMADHPTAGGYASIGTIAKADLPLLAQAQPEDASISFAPMDIADAQCVLLKIIDDLDSHLYAQEDSWLNL
jgi:antagonist of KipI